MSIIITNITEKRGVGTYGQGQQLYLLRMNGHVIAEFTHNFSDGLGGCLRKAAMAAEDPQRLENQLSEDLLISILEDLARK